MEAPQVYGAGSHFCRTPTMALGLAERVWKRYGNLNGLGTGYFNGLRNVYRANAFSLGIDFAALQI